jgi:hypothetical protein
VQRFEVAAAAPGIVAGHDVQPVASLEVCEVVDRLDGSGEIAASGT